MINLCKKCNEAFLAAGYDYEPDAKDARPTEDRLRRRVDELEEALGELIEVAELRGDNELPHPCDDALLWTAQMQDAWDWAEDILAKREGGA